MPQCHARAGQRIDLLGGRHCTPPPGGFPHRCGGFHGQAFIFQQLRSLTSSRQQNWFFPRSLALARRCLTSPCPRLTSPLCGSVSHSPLIRTSIIGLRPTLKTSFYPDHPFKDPVLEYSHILRGWELGLQHVDLGGTQFSPEQRPCLLKVSQVTSQRSQGCGPCQTRGRPGEAASYGGRGHSSVGSRGTWVQIWALFPTGRACSLGRWLRVFMSQSLGDQVMANPPQRVVTRILS